MDLERACQILALVEREHPVNELRLGGVRCWPLVRMALWSHLLHVDASAPGREPRAEPAAPGDLPSRPLRAWQALRDRVRSRRATRNPPRADALFLSRAEDHSDVIDGHSVDRHVDPLLELARESYSALKVESASSDAVAPVRRQPPLLLPPPSPWPPWGLPAARGFDAAELAAVLGEVAPGFRLDLPALRQQAARVLATRDVFRRLLARVRPRAAFMVCYYADAALGLSLACRERGIPSVDLQHGKQGIFEGLYSHWTRVPPEGYELLPTCFWTWGDASRRHLERWFVPGCSPHRVVVGGHRWLGWWKEGRLEERLDASLGARIRASTRTILVSLQPLAEPLPPLVCDAIRRAPEGWLWLVRLHPHQRARLVELRARLEALAPGRSEVEAATREPLYALLRHSDHHVTRWSSVCYEALAFGVPTTLVDPDGLKLYADDLRRARFAYAATADELLSSAAGTAARQDDGAPYIECSVDTARRALGEILASRAASPIR